MLPSRGILIIDNRMSGRDHGSRSLTEALPSAQFSGLNNTWGIWRLVCVSTVGGAFGASDKTERHTERVYVCVRVCVCALSSSKSKRKQREDKSQSAISQPFQTIESWMSPELCIFWHHRGSAKGEDRQKLFLLFDDKYSRSRGLKGWGGRRKEGKEWRKQFLLNIPHPTSTRDDCGARFMPSVGARCPHWVPEHVTL